MNICIKNTLIWTVLSVFFPLSHLSAEGDNDAQEQHSTSEESDFHEDNSTEASDSQDDTSPHLKKNLHLEKNLHKEDIKKATTEEMESQTGYMITSDAIGSGEELEEQIHLSSPSFATDTERKGFIEQAAQNDRQEFTKADIRQIISTKQHLMELGFAFISQGSGERSEKFQHYLSDMLQDDFIKNTSPFSDAAHSPFLRVNKEFFKAAAEKEQDNIFDQTADIFLTDQDFAKKTQLNKILTIQQGTDLFKKFLYRYISIVTSELFPNNMQAGNIGKGGLIWKRIALPILNVIRKKAPEPYSIPLLSAEQIIRNIIAEDAKDWNDLYEKDNGQWKKKQYLLNQNEVEAEQVTHELYKILKNTLDNPQENIKNTFIVKLHQASYMFLYHYIAAYVDTNISVSMSFFDALLKNTPVGIFASVLTPLTDLAKQTGVWGTSFLLQKLSGGDYEDSLEQKTANGLFGYVSTPERLLLKVALVNFCNAVYASSFERELKETQALEEIEKNMPASQFNQILFNVKTEKDKIITKSQNLQTTIKLLGTYTAKTTSALGAGIKNAYSAYSNFMEEAVQYGREHPNEETD